MSRATEAIELLEGGLTSGLLVTDHVMPGLTGVELLHRVGAVRPDVPVLVVAGLIERVTAPPSGVPILRKPFRLQDLVGQVRALVHAA